MPRTNIDVALSQINCIIMTTLHGVVVVPIGMALRQCVYATFRVLISRRVWMFTQLTTLLLLLILVLMAFEKNTELPLYKRDMGK